MSGETGDEGTERATDDADDRARRKLEAKIYNDRLKLGVDIAKGLILLLLGVGLLRFLLDPDGAGVGFVQTVLVLASAAFLIGVAWFVLGMQRSED